MVRRLSTWDWRAGKPISNVLWLHDLRFVRHDSHLEEEEEDVAAEASNAEPAAGDAAAASDADAETSGEEEMGDEANAARTS